MRIRKGDFDVEEPENKVTDFFDGDAWVKDDKEISHDICNQNKWHRPFPSINLRNETKDSSETVPQKIKWTDAVIYFGWSAHEI